MDNKTKLLKGIFEHLHEAYMLMELYQDASDINDRTLNLGDTSIISFILSKIDNELRKQGETM